MRDSNIIVYKAFAKPRKIVSKVLMYRYPLRSGYVTRSKLHFTCTIHCAASMWTNHHRFVAVERRPTSDWLRTSLLSLKGPCLPSNFELDECTKGIYVQNFAVATSVLSHYTLSETLLHLKLLGCVSLKRSTTYV